MIAWATDIHLEHTDRPTRRAFAARLQESGASVVLLGGDNATASDVDLRLAEFADSIGLPVFFVLGNHDFYGGSIAEVRQRMADLDRPGLRWLPTAGPQESVPGVGLVGHSGWADARLGNFAGSDVVLNDYVQIAELSSVFDRVRFTGVFGEGTQLESTLHRLGQEAANALRPQVVAAAKTNEQVVVLTHVPPFREACWHEGQISDDAWLPHFSCGAMGEMLREVALQNPTCRFTVLCGHTHGDGIAQIESNLVVHTQAAVYGDPGFLLVEAGVDGIEVHS